MISGRTPIDIVLDAGSDERADPKVMSKVMPGGVIRRIENMQYDRAGRLAKRHGYEALSSDMAQGEAPVAPQRIAELGDSLVMIGAERVASRMDQDPGWVDHGTAPVATLQSSETVTRIGDADFDVSMSETIDMDVGFGCHWVAYQRAGQIFVSAREIATGTILFHDYLIGGDTTGSEQGRHPRVVFVPRVTSDGGLVYVLWQETGETRIRYRYIDGAGGEWSAPATLVNNTAGSQQSFDAVAFAGDVGIPAAGVTFIYSHVGGMSVGFMVVDSEAFGGITPDSPVIDVGIDERDASAYSMYHRIGGQWIWVVWRGPVDGIVVTRYDVQGGFTAVQDTTLDATTSPSMNRLGIVEIDPDQRVVATWQPIGAVPTPQIFARTVDTAGTLGGRQDYFRVHALSRPFIERGDAYVYGLDRGSVPLPHVLLRLSVGGELIQSGIPESDFGFGRTVAPFPNANSSPPCSVPMTADGSRLVALATRLIPTGVTSPMGIEVHAWRFDDEQLAVPVLHAGSLFFSGGSVWQFDGNQLTELGFTSRPAVFDSSFSVETTGGSIADGTYQYIFVWEWLDSQGRRHQSAPSNTIQVVVSGGSGDASVEWEIQTLHATRKTAGVPQVYLVCYRTLDGPGVIFHRNQLDPPVYIEPDEDELLLFVDTIPDGVLAVGEPLYTSAGELINEMPPPSRHLVVHNGRLAGIDAEFGYRIWLTKPLREDEGPAYASSLQILIDDTDLTALASQDGKLYAFTRDAVYLASWGDGPDATGSGPPFPSPQLLSRDAGCDEPRSVVVGPDGIYFAGAYQGSRGIYLLPRGDGSPIPLSDRVRDVLLDYPEVTSAVLLLEAGHVRWTARSSDGTSGRVLVYDFVQRGEDGLGRWSVYALPTGGLSTGTSWRAQHVAADGQRVMVQRDGYADVPDHGGPAYYVPWSVELGDLRPGGIGVLGRVHSVGVLGEWRDDEELRLEASYDAGQSYPEQAEWELTNEDHTQGDALQLVWQPPTSRLERGQVRYRLSGDRVGWVPTDAGEHLLLWADIDGGSGAVDIEGDLDAIQSVTATGRLDGSFAPPAPGDEPFAVPFPQGLAAYFADGRRLVSDLPAEAWGFLSDATSNYDLYYSFRTTNTSQHRILATSGLASGNQGLLFRVNDFQRLQLLVGIHGTGITQVHAGDVLIEPETTYRGKISKRGTLFELYIFASLEASETVTDPTVGAPEHSLVIGSSSSGGQALDGFLPELFIIETTQDIPAAEDYISRHTLQLPSADPEAVVYAGQTFATYDAGNGLADIRGNFGALTEPMGGGESAPSVVSWESVQAWRFDGAQAFVLPAALAPMFGGVDQTGTMILLAEPDATASFQSLAGFSGEGGDARHDIAVSSGNWVARRRQPSGFATATMGNAEDAEPAVVMSSLTPGTGGLRGDLWDALQGQQTGTVTPPGVAINLDVGALGRSAAGGGQFTGFIARATFTPGPTNPGKFVALADAYRRRIAGLVSAQQSPEEPGPDSSAGIIPHALSVEWMPMPGAIRRPTSARR